MIRSLAVIATTALLVVPVTATAKKRPKPVSTARAQLAVKQVLREDLPDVSSFTAKCHRMTLRRWLCDWTGVVDIDGRACHGTARATAYTYGILVRPTNESDSDYCYP